MMVWWKYPICVTAIAAFIFLITFGPAIVAEMAATRRERVRREARGSPTRRG